MSADVEYPNTTISNPSPSPFIGRRQELFELERALDSLMLGRGGVWMIEGEPGIGKSRMASELAARARDRNGRVLWAMCDAGQEGAPFLWPWTQIARQHSLDGNLIEPGAKSDASRRPINEAVQWPAEIEFEPNRAPIVRIEQIAETALGMLAEAARTQPLIVIFEDAERSDPLSLELLGAAARELHQILIVVSCHTAALRNSPSLNRVFSDSVFNRARHIQLKPFDGDELTRLVAAHAGFSPEAATMDHLKRLSGGNPRFAELIIDSRLADSSGGDEGARMTLTARAAVERHLRPLSRATRSALTFAAMIGLEFELRVLEQLCPEPHELAHDTIGEAEAAGIVRTVERRPGAFAFVHALVREALRAEVPARESVRLHRRIGLALSNLHAFDQDYLRDIATHLFYGASEDASDPKPTQYCERAARHAEDARDFAAAARFYRMALTTLDQCADGCPRQRCDLLLALGRAESRDGNAAAAARSLTSAAELAELNRDAGRFARTALTFAGDIWHIALGSQDAPQVKSLLEKSLRMLGDSASGEAAMVSARLAAELYSRGESPQRQRALSERAIAIARGADDPEALLAVLHYRHLILLPEPERGGERLGNAEEMLDIASRTNRDEEWCLAFALRQMELVRTGDLMRADAGAAALSNAARTTGKAVFTETLAAWTAMRALIDGRFEDALKGAQLFLEFAEKLLAEAPALFLPGAVTMLRELERLHEAKLVAARAAEAQPWLAAPRAALAQIHLGLGDVEAARAMLRALLAQGCSDLARDASLPVYAAALAELCAELNEYSCADELYEALLPHENLNVVLGPFAFAGPAARYLGILAGMRGRFADAERHFLGAIRLSSRTAARPWIAYSEIDYAEMLLERGGDSDRELAAGFISSGLNMARALAMRRLASRAVALKERLDSHPRLTGASARDPVEATRNDGRGLTPSSSQENLFRREGDYWTIVFHRQTIRLKHAKGLAMIAWLLRHPHREFLAWTLDNLASGGHPAPEGEAIAAQFARELHGRSGPGDPGPLLDAQARSAYETRLKELREDLAEAKSFNDIGKVSAIEEELGFIASELSRGVGLDGRVRKWPTETERARVNVTNAVRTALARIRREHPALARYLSNTVKTGRFCGFDPDPSFPEEWII